jgi:hypothetical protein
VENILMRLLTILIVFAVLLTNLAAMATQEAAGPQKIQNVPEGEGVFCRVGGSQWIKLEPATVVDTKTEGMKQFMETAGLSTIYTTITYGRRKASLRVSDAQPVFFIRGIGSAQDALIVRLTQKNGNRETYTESSNTSYDNKGGYRTSDICRVLVTPYSKDAFSAKPEEVLKSGEYLITFGNINVGYDFGVAIRAE